MTSQEKSATVYIIRHGETIGNDTRVFLHPDQDVLSDTGKQLAKRLAETLKHVEFTQAFVSQYPRTQQTAKIILAENDANRGLEPVIDPNIGEIKLPNCYGKDYKYILGGIVKYLQSKEGSQDFSDFELDGSEPVPAIKNRAKTFTDNLVKKIQEWNPGQTVLVVSHGGFMRLLMEVLSDTDSFDIQGWDKCGTNVTRNTGLMKLTITTGGNEKKPKINFIKLHDYSHYPPEMLGTDSLTRMVQTPEGKCLSGCFQV